jgi:UPF0042 nucleotide-binding protein
MKSPARPQRGRLMVVTGMSGAGRSTALKAFEDMGYEAVDNLPLSLLPNLFGPRRLEAPLAIGVDVRTRDFAVPALLKALDELVKSNNIELRMVFLDCDDDRLERRYTETRRRHPLAADHPVADGIRLERQRVWPLRDRADLVIDTSSLTSADLKRVLQGHFRLDHAPGIAIFVTSFSYRHGLPRDADLVFDMRFLKNPHYVQDLQALSGRDREVGKFIESDPDFQHRFQELCDWLAKLLPRYEAEGKSYLTIALGCTGGRHRSVYAAERLAAWFAGTGRSVGILHRDLDRPEPGTESAQAPEHAVKDIA